MKWTISKVLLLAVGIRLALIIYARAHDALAEVSYTDVDYVVFTNASRFVAAGASPFDEPTYRYTPIIAWLLLPNVYFEDSPRIQFYLKDWGKLLFSSFDILVGVLIYATVRHTTDAVLRMVTGKVPTKPQGNDSDEQSDELELTKILQTADNLLRRRKSSQIDSGSKQKEENEKAKKPIAKLAVTLRCVDPAFVALLFWLFNPLTLVVSSRGSMESFLAFFVLLTVYSVIMSLKSLRDEGEATAFVWLVCSAVFLGFAIHLKLYPVIYVPSVFLKLARIDLDDVLSALSSFSKIRTLVCRVLSNFRGWLYILVSSAVFFSLLRFFRSLYGYKFVYETYLYHAERIDSQHNFSPYYYAFFLLKNDDSAGFLAKAAFLPQLIFILYFSLIFNKDLPFCWFLITYAFVSWNKVCTSQYFLWYLCLLPLIIHKIETWKGIKLLILWFLGQGLWLLFAYMLEFRGLQVQWIVGACSVVFLGVNMYCLFSVIVSYVQ